MMGVAEIVILTGIVALIAMCAVMLTRVGASNHNCADTESARRNEERGRAELEARMAEMQRLHERQIAELRESTAMQFSKLAGEALQRQEDRLRSESDRHLKSVLDPLKMKIDEFSRSVSDAYVKDNASRQSLSDQIDRLMQLNMTIGEEARSLAAALKGDSKVQGDWGEMVLETLLESAGLKRDVNFFTQVTRDGSGASLRDEEGHGLRPDVLVLLPDNHKMVIDSKVSLKAYSDLCAACDDSAMASARERHVRSVRKHIDELASKRYQELFADAAEHILMFIPNEGAYFAAIQGDSSLWKYAYDRRVVIVSPTHIFSVMQIVTQLWRQENQQRNIKDIVRQGNLVYDAARMVIEDVEQLGAALRNADKAYEACYDHLTRGPRNLVKRADRLRQMGLKPAKTIPAQTLQSAETEES